MLGNSTNSTWMRCYTATEIKVALFLCFSVLSDTVEGFNELSSEDVLYLRSRRSVSSDGATNLSEEAATDDNSYTSSEEIQRTASHDNSVVSDTFITSSASPTIIMKTNASANISQMLSVIESLSERFFDTSFYHIKLDNLRAQILLLQNKEDKLLLSEKLAYLEEKLSRWTIVRKYLDPVVYTIIITVGMLGNTTLLIILARHKEIRTAPSIIILNIAISDIISLICVAPTYYLSEYLGADVFPGALGCPFHVFVRVTIMGVTEISIATLSMQRLLATKAFKAEGSLQLLLTTSRHFVRLVTLGIWFLCMFISSPMFFAFEHTDGTCFPHILKTKFYSALLICYIILFVSLPLPIIFLSILTVRRLRSKTKYPVRSVRIIKILTAFYLLVYIPRAFWYGYVSWYRVNRREIPFIFIDELLSFLHFLDACLNPLALCVGSKTYRNLFQRYLCFWKKTKDGNSNLCKQQDYRKSKGQLHTDADSFRIYARSFELTELT